MPPSAPPPNHPPLRSRALLDVEKVKSSSEEEASQDILSSNNGAFDTSNYETAVVPSAYGTATAGDTASVLNSGISPYANSLGAGMYGGNSLGGMYGGTFGGIGGIGSLGVGSMMYGGAGLMPYGGGPMSGLNQFLFGVQNVVASLSQAVQIVGMNGAAVTQLLESASSMLDHALKSWNEIRTLEHEALKSESPEAKKQRRRLRALRWAMTTAVTYAAYSLVRKLLSFGRRQSAHALLGPPSALATPRYYSSNVQTPASYHTGSYSSGYY